VHAVQMEEGVLQVRRLIGEEGSSEQHETKDNADKPVLTWDFDTLARVRIGVGTIDPWNNCPIPPPLEYVHF